MLELDGVTHRFPDGTYGLRGVSLAVPFDGVTVLAGANGAGKTLLSRHMLALEAPSGGEVRLDGIPVSECLPALRRRVGLVFQDADSQFVGQSVEEDIAFGLEHRPGVSGRQAAGANGRAVDEVLERFELTHLRSRDPHALSGGEKRRAAIAAIVVTRPELVIFDEPFANLDFPGVASVLRHVVTLAEEGIGIFLITHEIEKVLAHADRLIVMHAGEVAADDSPRNLIDRVDRWSLRKPREALEHLSWMA